MLCLVLEQSFLAGDGLGHRAGVDLLGSEECVVGIDVHAKSLGDTGYIASHVTEGEDTQFLSHELGAALSVVEVADGIDKHAHNQLGNGVAVLAGGVHGHNATLGAGLEVEVVVTGTGTDDDFQVFGVVDDLSGDFVGADDKSFGILNSCVEVVHVGVFLEKSQFVAILLNHFADAVNSNLGKGFFGSN